VAEKESKAAEDAGEQLRRIKVADLVVQAATGLVSLGFVRLAGDQRDLAQARLAIDSLRALEPVLREQVSGELGDELQRAIVSMQLAYAEAASPKGETAAPGESEPAAETSPAEPESGEQAPDSPAAGE
jgi:hypothetical protein